MFCMESTDPSTGLGQQPGIRLNKPADNIFLIIRNDESTWKPYILTAQTTGERERQSVAPGECGRQKQAAQHHSRGLCPPSMRSITILTSRAKHSRQLLKCSHSWVVTPRQPFRKRQRLRPDSGLQHLADTVNRLSYKTQFCNVHGGGRGFMGVCWDS